MLPRVKFAFAHDAHLHVVRADQADKLCTSYTCRGCGRPVQLCYGDIVKTRHFRHKVQVWAPGEHCDYQDETYAHRQAKAILQQQQWVRVPPVLPRREEGYHGPVRALREARTIKAKHVYNECTLYENAACGLDFQRQREPFVAEPGQRDFVCRPDVLFTDAADKPVLLIEIHVTHEVGYRKLVGLRRVQIDTIEITIPYYAAAKEIEILLASYSATKWLYNHERETADPIRSDTAGPAPFDRVYPAEAPVAEPESLECQLHEVREASRSLRKFMAGAAMGALVERLAAARSALDGAESDADAASSAQLAGAEADLRREFAAAETDLSREEAELGAEEAVVADLFASEQTRLAGEIATAELALRAVYQRAAPGLQQRVAARRAAYQRIEQALAASRAQLRDRLAAEEAALDQRFQRAKEKLECPAANPPDLAAATAGEYALQDRLTRLGNYLASRSRRPGDELQRAIGRLANEEFDFNWRRAQASSLDEQEAIADQETAVLEREEAALAEAEGIAQQLQPRRADRVMEARREILLDSAA